ncbi:MAG TPA: hypothetical protein VNB23_02720, partial [Ramlibacter sp.]|nr:hypothetical protein [Ramlibacter sp.]
MKLADALRAPRHRESAGAAWWRHAGWALLAPLVVYGVFAFRDLAVPGLYMDAVNPDYQAAWLVRGSRVIPDWTFPDNAIAGWYRLPLLNSLYGGNTPAYLGLLFFTVAGFGVESVRIFHALLGALVLCAFWWGLRQWRVPKAWVAAVLCVLAADPTFVFGWRTQFYLQMFPLLFLALGLGLLGRHQADAGDARKEYRTLFLAGALLGFSAYGYFVFAFHAAAAIAVYAHAAGWRQGRLAAVGLPLVAGAAAGWLPYAYAHFSIVQQAGLPSYLQELRNLQSTYGVIDAGQGGFLARAEAVAQRIGHMVRARGITHAVLASDTRHGLAAQCTALVLWSGPFLLAAAWFTRRNRPVVLGGDPVGAWLLLCTVLAAMLGLHLVFGFAIGRPLGLQHYIMLLPVLYTLVLVPLAILIARPEAAAGRAPRSLAVLGAAAVLATANATSSATFAGRLSASGGVGLYSDATNALAAEVRKLPAGT